MSEPATEPRPWIWKTAIFLFPALLALSTVIAIILKVTDNDANEMTKQEFAVSSFDENSLKDSVQKLERSVTPSMS